MNKLSFALIVTLFMACSFFVYIFLRTEVSLFGAFSYTGAVIFLVCMVCGLVVALLVYPTLKEEWGSSDTERVQQRDKIRE